MKINTYSVYKHVCPNGKCYIGLTKNKPEYRWRNGKGYKNISFYKAILKYGWNNIDHYILYSNLTYKQASIIEQKLINKYKSNNPKYGYNIEGGGIYNKKVTAETRKKQRISHLGQIPWNKGLKTNENTKNKIRNSLNPKPIICIELNLNFPSIQNASKQLKIPSGNIAGVCNGKRKTANGFSFKYIIKEINNENKY